MPSHHIDKISLAQFKAVLARYPDVAPPGLSELDSFRYDALPARLAEMGGNASLQKEEVVKLVEWKLKHGTYRPTLLSLVQSNPAALIQSTTHSAFTSLLLANDNNTTNNYEDKDENGDAEQDVLAAIKTLTPLRGIGPATASLLLSVFAPATVPFFGDEVFRWVTYRAGTAGGWKRKIKYNHAEYKELVQGVRALRRRLGVSAIEVERVGFVLGREGGDVDVDINGEEGHGESCTHVNTQESNQVPTKPDLRKEKTKTKTKTKTGTKEEETELPKKKTKEEEQPTTTTQGRKTKSLQSDIAKPNLKRKLRLRKAEGGEEAGREEAGRKKQAKRVRRSK
ncbi:hypothetical protein EKO04_008294 [Ascochyta lentis]|uniref:Uncharacterized protein n=1 Tax=Ascochyta lentis TaxID=205686 RepID=A0A8H7MEZ5_9PLEO|nr:hypothetical protein EKO04_008294 [Ascochyta lentis]